MQLCHIHVLIFTFNTAIESYEYTDYSCFIHFEKQLTILEPKQKKYFLKFIFFCKMLNLQDFSKWINILKSTVQYLCRDISNVKIGLYLRSSHKKDWKTHFGPTALKNPKNWKKKTVAPPHFSVSFRQKKNFENRTTVAMRLAPPLALVILNRRHLYICIN